MRKTISREEIIVQGIHLEAKICTKIFTPTKSPGTLVSRSNHNNLLRTNSVYSINVQIFGILRSQYVSRRGKRMSLDYINIKCFAYQFRDERDGFPPGSNIRHTVDVAIKRIVSRVPIIYTVRLREFIILDKAVNSFFLLKNKPL